MPNLQIEKIQRLQYIDNLNIVKFERYFDEFHQVDRWLNQNDTLLVKLDIRTYSLLEN